MTLREYINLLRIEAVIRNRPQHLFLDEIKKLIEIVFSGKTVAEALEIIEEKRAKKLAKAQRIERSFQKVSDAIVWVFTPVVLAFKKIRQWYFTLKDLIALFNERCPYVSKSEVLE